MVSMLSIALEKHWKVFWITIIEREANKTWDVLESQLKPLLDAFEGKDPVWMNRIVLAY